MSELPPRSLDDEIKYQIEVVRRELNTFFEAQFKEQKEQLETHTSAYRTRLLWFTSGIGALVVGLGVTYANEQITTRVNERVAAEIAEDTEFDLRLQRRIDESVDALFVDFSARLEEELLRTNNALQSARILPLVASEATAFANDDSGGYRIDSAEAVLTGLQSVAQQIEALSAFERELVFRRVDGVMRAFWLAGDYQRVLRVYQIFGSDLLAHGNAAITLTESVLSAVVIAGLRPNQEQLIGELMGIAWDSSSIALEYQQLLHLVVENDANWTSDNLLTAIRSEEARQAGFTNFIFRIVSQLEGEISAATSNRPQGINHSPLAIERHSELMTAIALSMSAAE